MMSMSIIFSRGGYSLWLDNNTVSHTSLEDRCLLYFRLLPSHGEFSSTTVRANLRTACVFTLPRMNICPHSSPSLDCLLLVSFKSVWKYLPLRTNFGSPCQLPGLPHPGLPEILASCIAIAPLHVGLLIGHDLLDSKAISQSPLLSWPPVESDPQQIFLMCGTNALGHLLLYWKLSTITQ